MDGREGIGLSGSASYYLNRGGFSGSGSNSGPGVPTPPGYKALSNPNLSFQSNVRVSSVDSTFQGENPSPNFGHGISMAVATVGDHPGKKKRGRPRKYGPDGANMALGLSPMSSTPTEKLRRGRPPGSGRKQQLASLGGWMNNSAGLAFTPHVIHIPVGEDIAEKILSFAQQRPRALCILSANGVVSTVTLHQPTSGGTLTYEGRFEILCFSGSYLLSESGDSRNRTGGLSISVCSPDGQVIGGGIGGRLIAASLVQVIVCSFIYGDSKTLNKTEGSNKDDNNSMVQFDEQSSTPASASPSQNLTPNSERVVWPSSSQANMRNLNTGIDLMRG